MNESDLLAGVPDWAKYPGGTSGVRIAVALGLRQWWSSAKVDRTADEATSNTLRTLQEQLAAERTRADGLMHEREAMAQEIGQLRGEVSALRAHNGLAGAGSLLLTSMHMTLLGALLILAPRDVFAEICGRAADLGGQQLGGLLMLGIGTPVYLIAGLWLVGRDLRSTDPAPQT